MQTGGISFSGAIMSLYVTDNTQIVGNKATTRGGGAFTSTNMLWMVVDGSALVQDNSVDVAVRYESSNTEPSSCMLSTFRSRSV